MSLLSSVRLGVQRPRLLLSPPRVSSAGSEAVDLAASAGLFLDDWQRYALDVSLGERIDGSWAAFEVGLVAPRQNGKGSVLEARELAGLFLFDERLILHSAHEFKTAWEAFLRIKTLIEQTPDLERRVSSIRKSHADVSIELTNGARLRFVARSGGSGRGFSGDCVILDEAYNLDAAAMAALLPTLSARPNPQIWYASSAGMATSLQLHAVRKRAVAANEHVERLAWLEWSADPDAKPDDPEAWAQANPALGIRISEEFIHSERAALSGAVPEFMRERLGIWDEPDTVGAVITLDEWEACADPKSSPTDPVVFGVDASPDRQWATIVVAAHGSTGHPHLEVVDHRSGVGWLSGRLVELRDKWGPATVVVDPYSPAASEIAAAEAAGVPITKMSGAVLAAACGAFFDGVKDRTLRHRDDPDFRASLAVARKRQVGDGWAWSRRDSTSDITAIVAATLAFGALPAAGTNEHTSSPVVDLGDY
jgi:hypothetical protein